MNDKQKDLILLDHVRVCSKCADYFFRANGSTCSEYAKIFNGFFRSFLIKE
jgi:hypothetical protein